jgi:hypothetical protein
MATGPQAISMEDNFAMISGSIDRRYAKALLPPTPT